MTSLPSVASSAFPVLKTLLDYLHRMHGHRDRQQIHAVLLLATRALFGAREGELVRIARHVGASYALPLARLRGDAVETLDLCGSGLEQANLLELRPALQACVAAGERIAFGQDDARCEQVPLLRNGETFAVLSLWRAEPFNDDELVLLDMLCRLFVEHLNLIDYAETDTLTGLLNRKTFDDNLTQVLENVSGRADEDAAGVDSPRRREPHAEAQHWLAVADIDHFKSVNDTHGHIIGDEVLILFSRLMRHSFRFNDQLFRFGGEEFVMVLQPTSQRDAQAVLNRFRQEMAGHVFPIVGKVTVSIGFTSIRPNDTPTELVGRADQALYFAKTNGRNRVECYDDLLRDGLIHQVAVEKPKAELF